MNGSALNKSILRIIPFLFFAISSISKILNMVGIPRELPYAVYILIFLLFFIINIPRIRLFDICYYLIAIFLVAWGLYYNASYINSDTNILAVLINFLPAYFFFRFCEEDNILRGLKTATYVNIVYLLIYYLMTVRSQTHYSMDYAYAAAVPLCVIMYYYIQDKKPWKAALIIVLFLSIVVFGNRGAMVFPLLCGAYYLYTDSKFDSKKRNKMLLGIMAFVMIVMILYIFSNQIVAFLEQYAGISRTISKIVTGEFFASSTRDRLYEQCKYIIESMQGGQGPLSSRRLIVGFIYPHSLLYELQIDYGRLLGATGFALIIYAAIRNLIVYRNRELRLYVAVISILGIGCLMISSSLYYEIYVPATIALYINSKQASKSNSFVRENSNETMG